MSEPLQDRGWRVCSQEVHIVIQTQGKKGTNQGWTGRGTGKCKMGVEKRECKSNLQIEGE